MTIAYARVVGELSPGFITIVFNPDMTGTEALNNTGSELIATLAIDIVPLELREPEVDVWYAVEQLDDGSKSYIKKVLPMTSNDIPQEYYRWLEENGISRDS